MAVPELRWSVYSAPEKREISVFDAVVWAFRDECASIDLPVPDDVRETWWQGASFGMEYVLIQRARLGCQVDGGGGGGSDPHEDAEVIAAAVQSLGATSFGWHMAIAVAELGRAARAPDWMPGAVPRIEPIEWTSSRHGKRGRSQVLYVIESKSRRGRTKRQEVRWTPCRWSPSAEVIAASRRRYLDWWAALEKVRENLQVGCMLRRHTINDRMPPAAPWLEKR